MEKIKPGSITKDIKPTKVPFKMMENAQQFIRACESYGVSGVFAPGELVNLENPMNIVSTIQALAIKAESQGFKPILIKSEAFAEEQKKKRFNFLSVSIDRPPRSGLSQDDPIVKEITNASNHSHPTHDEPQDKRTVSAVQTDETHQPQDQKPNRVQDAKIEEPPKPETNPPIEISKSDEEPKKTIESQPESIPIIPSKPETVDIPKQDADVDEKAKRDAEIQAKKEADHKARKEEKKRLKKELKEKAKKESQEKKDEIIAVIAQDGADNADDDDRRMREMDSLRSLMVGDVEADLLAMEPKPDDTKPNGDIAPESPSPSHATASPTPSLHRDDSNSSTSSSTSQVEPQVEVQVEKQVEKQVESSSVFGITKSKRDEKKAKSKSLSLNSSIIRTLRDKFGQSPKDASTSDPPLPSGDLPPLPPGSPPGSAPESPESDKKPRSSTLGATSGKDSSKLVQLFNSLPDATEDEAKLKERTRLNVINELISTERDYVRDLKLVETYFLKSLRENEIIDAQTISSIFMNVELLININKEMLDKLEQRIEESSSRYWLIGDILLSMADYFKMYTAYCSGYEQALQLIDKSLHIPAFEKWWKETHKNPELHGLSLRDYLVKPIQRICKYPLLVNQLLKNTNDLHVDYENLGKALSKLEAITSYVNEAKRHEESLSKIIEIQSILQGCDNLVAPTRKFIREGTLVFYKNGSGHTYHFFLFNDLLLYAKKTLAKKSSLNFRGKMSLHGCLVNASPDVKDIKNAFRLGPVNVKSDVKPIIVGCSSPRERDIWVEDIQKLIFNLNTSETKSNNRKSISLRGQIPTSPMGSPKPISTSTSLSTSSDNVIQDKSPENKSEIRQRFRTFSEQSKSPPESSIETPISPDAKVRTWKKASMSITMDTEKELEFEKIKREELLKWKAQHQVAVDALRKQVEALKGQSEKDMLENMKLRKEIEDTKAKLVDVTMQLFSTKETVATHNATHNPVVTEDNTASPSTPRWNKKVLQDTQDMNKRLNEEKKARRDLELWKAQSQEKLAKMQTKISTEIELRSGLTEQLRSLQLERDALKK
eukprot:TRINITY_DN2464_c0_g1_i1.p1 TRINITY_DN2464_c0_g1~~TRINITY_DN2464_c0_g1_i1.p1  ORF type:complete len:1117 (-),score=381.50 TRINITY_DN2464_c0_g1_i1:42-3215(-)